MWRSEAAAASGFKGRGCLCQHKTHWQNASWWHWAYLPAPTAAAVALMICVGALMPAVAKPVALSQTGCEQAACCMRAGSFCRSRGAAKRVQKESVKHECLEPTGGNGGRR